MDNQKESTIEKEQRLKEYSGRDQIISSHDLAESFKNKPESKIIPSGISGLDYFIDGFESAQVNVISGYTGHGKTLLGITLTQNFTEMGKKCLWFTYEINIRSFLDLFYKLPLFYMPYELTSNTLKWLEERILEAIIKFNTKIVFIDHLHYLVNMGRQDTSIMIGHIMRSLVDIAKKYGVIIFIVAHITKQKYSPTDDLDMGSVRDSSFIEQEASYVFYVWRRLKDNEGRDVENETILKIAKNRRNGNIGKKIQLTKIGGLLKDMSFDDR